MIFGEAHHSDTARMARYAPDLAKDPFYRWLTSYSWVPLTVLGFSLLAIGGWGLVNWAIFLRVVLGLHSTWLVNSATPWGAVDSPPRTTLETCGGWRSSRSARDGTTTITHPTSAPRSGLMSSIHLPSAEAVPRSAWSGMRVALSQIPEEEAAA
jgi:hypothetical protein